MMVGHFADKPRFAAQRRMRVRRESAVLGSVKLPFAKSRKYLKSGAQGRSRTTDTAIFSRMLYQLSYLGTVGVEALALLSGGIKPGVVRRVAHLVRR